MVCHLVPQVLCTWRSQSYHDPAGDEGDENDKVRRLSWQGVIVVVEVVVLVAVEVVTAEVVWK